MSQDASMAISRPYSSSSGGVRDASMEAASRSIGWPSEAEFIPLKLSPHPNDFSSGSRRFAAPSGYTDSDSDSGAEPEPSFSMRAPTGDSEGESDGEVTSTPIRPQFIRVVPPTAVQQALHEVQLSLRRKMLLSAQKDVASLRRKWLAIEEQEQRDYASVEDLMQETRAAIAGAESERQAALREGHEKLMSGLQQEHSSQAEAMDRKAQAAVRQAEEERQRAAAEEQRRQEEAAAKQRAAEAAEQMAREEAERKLRKEEDAAKRQSEAEAERQKKDSEEAEAEQAATAERRRQSSAADTSTSGSTPGVRVSPEAAEFERTCREALSQARAAAKELEQTSANKSDKRSVLKRINILLNQTGGTQQQVDTKARGILELLESTSGGLRAFAALQLARALLDLSEKADSRFPVAEVAVAVCNRQTDLVPVILGWLHEVCPLAVPKYFVPLKSESTDDLHKRWGFQRVETLDKATKRPTQGWEDVDVYLERVSAYLHFYAAFVQSDQQRAFGVEHGWRYLSRLLNSLPPHRYTAFALQSFIAIAGYKMHHIYRGQFIKLLMAADQHFVAEIVQKGMDEARSSVRRIRLYLEAKEYLNEPPGRRLERFDASSQNRA